MRLRNIRRVKLLTSALVLAIVFLLSGCEWWLQVFAEPQPSESAEVSVVGRDNSLLVDWSDWSTSGVDTYRISLNPGLDQPIELKPTQQKVRFLDLESTKYTVEVESILNDGSQGAEASATGEPVSQYRVGAICEDGWESDATGSGACSYHDGVDYWLYNYPADEDYGSYTNVRIKNGLAETLPAGDLYDYATVTTEQFEAWVKTDTDTFYDEIWFTNHTDSVVVELRVDFVKDLAQTEFISAAGPIEASPGETSMLMEIEKLEDWATPSVTEVMFLYEGTESSGIDEENADVYWRNPFYFE